MARKGKAKPEFEVFWMKGSRKINFRDPNIFFVLGRRGSGKSAFLETVACQHLMAGGKVLDLFGSKDGEGLAWLRSNIADKHDIKLIHGEMTELKNREGIVGKKFRLSDLKKADIFISASPLYADMDAEFESVNHVFDKLWNRTYWDVPIFIIVREAANLLYSRMKVSKSQTLAKADMTYMLRESRHSGLALGLDSTKHTSIDVNVRKLTDYLVLKNLGMYGLPNDLHWIYKYFDPNKMQQLNPNEFGMATKEGAIGLGTFDLPRWHKRTGEHILRKVGVKPEYYESEKESEQAVQLVEEALNNLEEPTPTEVSEWIKERKGIQLSPEGVGIYARRIGYHSEPVTRNGETKNLLRPVQG